MASWAARAGAKFDPRWLKISKNMPKLRRERSTYRALVATVAILREAGILLGEPDAGLAYEILNVLRDTQLFVRPSGFDINLTFGEGYLRRPEGLVAQKTNRGFVVADILTSQQMHQLFDVRHTLELHALSGVVVSRKDIETLQGLLEEMSKSKDGAVYSDYKDYLQHDNQFHRSLVSLSGNQFLLKAWEDLHVHLHLSRLYTGVGLFDRGDSNTEHQAIVDALQQNDNLQVLSLISQHIKRVSKRMETFLAG